MFLDTSCTQRFIGANTPNTYLSESEDNELVMLIHELRKTGGQYERLAEDFGGFSDIIKSSLQNVVTACRLAMQKINNEHVKGGGKNLMAQGLGSVAGNA